jgi:membrane protein implicated in regulation of membrane protease activity
MIGLEPIVFSHYLWLILAVGLLIVELIAPTQIAIGFAMGALLVSGGIYASFSWLNSTLIVLLTWIFLSFISWVLMRLLFKNRGIKSKIEKGDINEYD